MNCITEYMQEVEREFRRFESELRYPRNKKGIKKSLPAGEKKRTVENDEGKIIDCFFVVTDTEGENI